MENHLTIFSFSDIMRDNMNKSEDVVFKLDKFKKHVMMCMLFLAFIGLICLIVCFGILFLMRQTPNEPTSNDIFKHSVNSVVEVKAYTEDVGESFGTAEFIDYDGTLATNAHVVTYTQLAARYEFEHYYIRFATDEQYIEVSLVKYDADLDIAVLKMDPTLHQFTPMSTHDSSKLLIGEDVYAVGNLNNVGISLTKGVISNSNITVTYNEVTRNVIQCDLTIAEGNSGGALVNKDGKLIGITTFRLKDTSGKVIYGISYCIPINTVLEYIKN